MEEIIANRYAKALCSVGGVRKSIDKIDRQLDGFVNIIDKHPEIMSILTHPAISAGRKKAFMDKILKAARFSDEFRSFIFILIRKKRFALLGTIHKIFKDLVLFIEKQLKVYAYCAHPVAKSCDVILKARLEKIFQKKVHLIYKKDPRLLAGFRLKIGDIVYDASLNKALEELALKLS